MPVLCPYSQYSLINKCGKGREFKGFGACVRIVKRKPVDQCFLTLLADIRIKKEALHWCWDHLVLKHWVFDSEVTNVLEV